MPRISESTINEILSKIDIVDLVSEQVALSKKGKSYFGLCPFHSENTPSFSVEPNRKIFNCFSCGEKGNAITFLQKTKNLSFVEAVDALAERTNVQLDIDTYQKEDPNKPYYTINQEALNFYKMFLNSTKEGKTARSYLKQRDITEEMIDYFDLGLAPNAYDVLTKTLTKKDILHADLFDLGLIKQNDKDEFYDLFRERIMIPIKDEKNNTVAFSGRIYTNKDNAPKYINSPQTKVFTKSDVLYNLNNAIKHIKQNNRAILYEGYMDVFASYKADLKEAVASMGTSLTRNQVSLIKRYTDNIVICYDGDPPGIEAAGRAIKLCKSVNLSIKVVVLPDKLDPDDYIEKHGKKALNTYIENNWLDPIEFNYQKENMDIDFSKMLDIERFKKTIFDLIKNTSHSIIERYIQKLATDTGISVESIKQDFSQYTKRNYKNITRPQVVTIEIEDKYKQAEMKLINYFIKNKKYIVNYHNEFEEMFFIDQRVYELKNKIEEYYLEMGDDVDSLVDVDPKAYFDDAQLNFYNIKIKNHHQVELYDEEYQDFIDVLKKYIINVKITDYEKEIQLSTSNTEKIKLAEYRDLLLKEDKHG
ncbi:MAG: DNA primase [Candidatus Izimaplasma sp.]|nr:DNA primase [Candidatus Izimaplasma bacterium]